MTSRVLAFLAAVIAHIALIALLASERPVRNLPSTDESRTALVFLTPYEIAEPVEPATSLPRTTKGPRDASGDRGAISQTAPRASVLTPPDPSIDWSRASELAAERQADAMEAARRRDRGFTAHGTDRNFASPSPAPPEFHWDHAHTHRVEPIASGGLVINITDRCVLVIAGLIMPACSLGKIEARGDLFEHMHDTQQLGDTK
jgi:hypothetical protein